MAYHNGIVGLILKESTFPVSFYLLYPQYFTLSLGIITIHINLNFTIEKCVYTY